MSIDMKNFSGDTDLAAASPQLGSNSYREETQYEEVPVNQEILNEVRDATTPLETPQEVEVAPQPSQQELNFKALREEVDRIKAERDEFRQNLELLRANVQQQQQPPSPPEKKKILDGLADSDVPNVSEIRQAFEQREAEYQMRLEELQVQQQHSDYAEVLEKYTAPLLKQKPHLAEGIYGARNKALFAYELGKMAQAQQQPIPQKQSASPSETAQRIVENARKPGNLANVGGQSVLSKADYYATMSDAEFAKLASKNLGEI